MFRSGFFRQNSKPDTLNARRSAGEILIDEFAIQSDGLEHLRAAGFDLEDRVEDAMSPVKDRLGILPEHASCHTAEVDGYVIEGHVPAADIRRLLREKPPIRGLVLPGMPVGSPGMEVEGVDAPAYTVLALYRDGSTTPYAEHSP